MALADVVEDLQEPCAKVYAKENFDYFNSRFKVLAEKCIETLEKQGFNKKDIVLEPYLHMKYDGTDCALMCVPKATKNDGTMYGDFMDTFIERYKSEFGFTLKEKDVIVEDIRMRGVGKTPSENAVDTPLVSTDPIPDKLTQVYFDGGYQSTKVFLLKNLLPGQTILGPAIIIDALSTILVEPSCTAIITKSGDIKINIGTSKLKEIGTELDTIQLSIFGHRFMSIAEQMGR